MCLANIHLIAKMSKLINKRKRLTFEEKCQLIREVKSGIPKQNVIQKYGISERMYRIVLSRETDFNNKIESYEYQNKKSSRTSSDVHLDAAVFEWFKQARDRGDPLSGPIIQEKARILDEKINGSQTFKASNGWLSRFRMRYGIRLKEERLSNNSSKAAEFLPIFKAKIESENLKLDNIYNADESGILWRLLTACTLPLHIEEKEALKKKECKDRVTALFCANASGSHRIPLLLIGESENPTCLINHVPENLKDQRLKNLKILGVIYTHQDSAWMDKSIFLLWYKEEFIPRVLERQRQDAIAGKVVLLLDNAPCHPSLDELNAINENFEVLYLPPNVPASNQPMAQGLIAMTKKLFKKELLRSLFRSEESEGAILFLKEFDLPDCFGMLSLAWDAVKSSSLKKAWKPLLTDSHLLARLEANLKLGQEEDPLFIDDAVLSESDSTTDFISLSDEICDQVSELLSGPDYSVEKSKEYLLNWFESRFGNDYIDCGWESLSDSDIVSLVTTRRREPESLTKIKKNENIFKNPSSVNFVANDRPESEIEKNETMLDDPVFVNFFTSGIYEPEIIPKVEKSETVLEDPVLKDPVLEDPALEDPVLVNLVRNSRYGSEIVTQIENSETVLEDLVFVNFVTNVRSESENLPKIKNSETIVKGPVFLSPVKNGSRGSKIGTGIEKNETVLEDPVFDNFVLNHRREPKIEKSETVLDNSENMEITSSLEACGYLMKFKNWAKSRRDCLPMYLDYIRELENWATEPVVCSWI